MVKDYGLRIQVLPFVICAIAHSFEHVRKVMVGVAMGLGMVLFFCFKWGQMQYGRFLIPDTSLSNGNDLAMHIVLFSCLAIALLAGGKGVRFFLLTAMPVALYYVLKTGSRANLLTVILLLLVCFILLPARQKMTMVALAIFLPVVVVPFLPSETTSRLVSFFSASSGAADAAEAEQNAEAVDSTNARLDLQWRAIQLTGENLLLGIGPLNFADAVEEMVRKHGGGKSGWQVAHNSYLEVSAETGIPGVIFYAWNILLCLKLNFQALKRFKNQPGSRAPFLVTFSLLAATCTYAFGIFFTTIPYDFQLALLVGLTAAMNLASEEQSARNAASTVMGFAPRRRTAQTTGLSA